MLKIIINNFKTRMGNGQINNNTKQLLESSISTELITKFTSDTQIEEKKIQNKKVILVFYSTFKYYLNKYNFDGIRKYRIDCIIKKAKAKFMKSLHYAIKYCLSINVEKLPQSFILNIKIDFNKKYFKKTIEEIYTEFKIIPSLSEITEKKLINKGKEELFELLMKSNVEFVYQIYLMSKLYQYHRNQIIKKNNEGVGVLYDFIANNLCKYYEYSDAGQMIKRKGKKYKKLLFETDKK